MFKIIFFQNVTTCRLVDRHQCCRKNFGSTFRIKEKRWMQETITTLTARRNSNLSSYLTQTITNTCTVWSCVRLTKVQGLFHETLLITLHLDCFKWHQTGQRSVLFQPVWNWDPHILIQCIAFNMKGVFFYLLYLKNDTKMISFSSQTSITQN